MASSGQRRESSTAASISSASSHSSGSGSSSSSSSSSPSSPPTSTADQFLSLLHHPTGRSLFYTYLQSGFSEHHLAFWEVVEEYRGIEDADERKDRAEVIYNQFVKNGTKEQINITEQQRMRVKEHVESPTKTMFDEAQLTAMELIKGNYFYKFKETQQYQQFIESVQKNNKEKKSSICVIL